MCPIVIGRSVDGLQEFKISMHPHQNMRRRLFHILMARLAIYGKVFRLRDNTFEETIDPVISKSASSI